MKCLTIRQPWANAIFDAGKDIENRSRNIAGTFRGPLAIHVSQTFDGQTAVREIQRIHPGFELGELYAGHVIGVVDLVDVHRYPDCRDADGAHCSWWGEQADGIVHLVLENPRRLRYPMWAVGKLGLWEISDVKIASREFVEVVGRG